LLMKSTGRYAAALVALVGLQGCGGGGGGTPSTPPPPPSQETSGLDTPPSNTTCPARGRPSPHDPSSLTPHPPGLTVNQPVAMLQAPNDSSRWFVVQKEGAVKMFSASSPTSTSNFIDITSRVDPENEQGLLGMAFAPTFPTDPRVFLSYVNTDSGRVSRIS